MSRSFGIYYYGIVYDTPPEAYAGDFTITFSSGFSVNIPHDQLVVPQLTIDKATGALHANGSSPELVINSIQQGNADDLPKLGRQLLSSSYLMVNQDSGTYTMWEASLDKNEDLVAVDRKNRLVDQFCSAADDNSKNNSEATTSPSPQPTSSPGSDNSGLSKGAIAGIVVGCVAFVAIVAAIGFFVIARKRRLQKKPAPAPNYADVVCAGAQGELGGTVVKTQVPQELPGKSGLRPFSGLPELP